MAEPGGQTAGPRSFRSDDAPRYALGIRFDPRRLKRNALARGFSEPEADLLAEVALMKLREATASCRNAQPVTLLELTQAILQHATDEVKKAKARDQRAVDRALEMVYQIDEVELEGFLYGDDDDDGEDNENADAAMESQGPCLDIVDDPANPIEKRFVFADSGLNEYFGSAGCPYGLSTPPQAQQVAPQLGDDGPSLWRHGGDIITAMCQHVELTVELAKHLGPESILTLYSMSRAFHTSLSSHLLSSIRQIIAYKAPEAGRVFPFNMFRRLLVPDPAGRTRADMAGLRTAGLDAATARSVRCVPGLKYLQLVLLRDRCCHDILAILARNGLRTPPGTWKTLRIWLVMSIATTRQRRALMRNRTLWTDVHLYNAQLFFVKLGMLFSDPYYGGFTYDVPNIILGKKSLYFLWQVLTRRKLTTLPEVMAAKLQYDYDFPIDDMLPDADVMGDLASSHLYGVHFLDIGRGHLEGWGMGSTHLQRPDEVVPYEAILRGLKLDEHLVHMMTWGYFDWQTGENLVPSEDEIYISDDEAVLARVDTDGHWRPKHAMKKRWSTLTRDEQREIEARDEDDRLRLQAWETHHPDLVEAEDENQPPSLDDEITRGYTLPPPPVASPNVPALADRPAAWADFGDRARRTLPVELYGDERLRAQAWNVYRDEGAEAHWSWEAWLKHEQQDRAAAAAAREATAAMADEDVEHGQDGGVDDGAHGADAGDTTGACSHAEDDSSHDETMWAEDELDDYIDDLLGDIMIDVTVTPAAEQPSS